MYVYEEYCSFLSFAHMYLELPIKQFEKYNTINHSLLCTIWTSCKESGNMGHKKKNVDLSQMNYLLRHFFQWNNFISDYFFHYMVTPNISKHMLHRELKLYLYRLTGRDIKNE